jgi:hypothetical protein
MLLDKGPSSTSGVRGREAEERLPLVLEKMVGGPSSYFLRLCARQGRDWSRKACRSTTASAPGAPSGE